MRGSFVHDSAAVAMFSILEMFHQSAKCVSHDKVMTDEPGHFPCDKKYRLASNLHQDVHQDHHHLYSHDLHSHASATIDLLAGAECHLEDDFDVVAAAVVVVQELLLAWANVHCRRNDSTQEGVF
jgi:hypothetical protein